MNQHARNIENENAVKNTAVFLVFSPAFPGCNDRRVIIFDDHYNYAQERSHKRANERNWERYFNRPDAVLRATKNKGKTTTDFLRSW